jgi:2-polyprenyl-3-methyl-5-hydroxy-6-metoxy-1,4-benzoquinol methylase
MTMLDDQQVAQAAADGEEAAGHLLRILNDGSVAVLLSLGHQVGLLDALADLPPSGSAQLADAAGLDERYVREWLGGIVTAGLADYDPAARTYRLREDYAPLVAGPGVDNLARQMQYVTLMAEVTPRVAERFRTGGGLDYSEYPRFQAIMAEESAAVLDASLVQTTVPLAGVGERLEAGIDVADFGCGSGHAVNLLAAAYPASRFTGLDFSAAAIESARAEAHRLGLGNVEFEVVDVATVQRPGAYDLVTAFDAIHDQAHPATVLSAIHSSLRPGGTFLMVDIKASSHLENNLGLPWAGFLYAISTLHCMSVSLGQGGEGLGTVWGTELATRMLREAGFASVDIRDLEEDPFNAYFVARA